MAMHVPQGQMGRMMKDGAQHYSGVEEAVYRNIKACKDISQIVKTSFGPNGMNKMIINHLDRLFVTNDAATMIQELEVEHPAAKLLVLASEQQAHEVGDGTNFVIVFAGMLLHKAEGLLRMGLSPAEILDGFEKAKNLALEMLPALVCDTVKDTKDQKEMERALKTSLMSKQYGYEDFLSELVAKACIDASPRDDSPFNVDYVRVVKIPGQGVLSSTCLQGMLFKREAGGAITSVEKAKVAVYTGPVDWVQTETKGTVLIQSADELKNFSKGEESMLEAQCQAIKDAGVNVVISGSKFGDMAQHFLNRMGIMMVKIMSKHELRRLCRAIKATPLPRLTPPSAHELGHCDKVSVEEIGDVRVTCFVQSEESSPVDTIVIRGSTLNMMDDIERAVDDGVNVYKACTKDPRLVPGAGATEIELALRLQKHGEAQAGLDQYAIVAFAEALECVPQVLAENAGMKAKDMISMLYAAHAKGEQNAGVDISNDYPGTVDAAKAMILDNLPTKTWGITFATTAAITVLRVDQIIMAKKSGGPKGPTKGEEI
jgi:T-complex protein 1 subunit theta